MIKLYDGGVYLVNGTELVPEQETEKLAALCGEAVQAEGPAVLKEKARET